MKISLVTPLILLLLVLFLTTSLLSLTADAIAGCGEDCHDLNDCKGQLICTEGQCADDPDVGTNICGNDDDGEKEKPSKKKKKKKKKSGKDHNRGDDNDDQGSCKSDGTKECHSGTYKTYTCSPPVTDNTKATLTVNSFEEGGDGGGKSECDDSYHSDGSLVAALSTGWYHGGSRCGKKIKIMANGKHVIAKVVDECDSVEGCDHEHAGQPPCKNNIVDGSPAVWEALGLDQDRGEVPVTWAMAD